MNLGGTITFESDQPLVIKELLPEGCAMKKLLIIDEWDFKSAGGCGNFGTYNKNPVFGFNLIDDSEFQVRMKILGEVSDDGT